MTTSGIEPVFMPVYKRRRKVNPNDVNVHVDFVDESGDSFEEFIVFHHKFAEWMKITFVETSTPAREPSRYTVHPLHPHFQASIYGRPYEIFTGIADDEEGIMLPKAVTTGKIVFPHRFSRC